ncbi:MULTISPECIES: acyl-CoA thioesterase [Myxococcus]|uniref:Thioesterase domain protein n=1 Tax=Myxococcus xanthus (strain DK1622) TaxID=246197 RepID=Q1D964_MYXXD|nr:MULTISPECIES: acyl-CoA thioesterase [Myxococcus]ABF91780.1 thioesterase domain protein [Myxococcus xanthus DK 1622]NOJ57974.1 acyl-CoA thioesterase [Myxococcus xanthus]NOK06873.1 acyl-CoA thioesterase [Myxococcus xanthus]QPM82098.1 acyl-CoA thioesterase [Myxococcus xanthus]QQR46864.1 acyl-CoA thioesterase [Myxococcus xanthus]
MTDLSAKNPKDTEVVMTQLILPPDANNLDAAFGGKVMQWIDICGAVAAQRHCRQVVVTASMDDLHFHAPIKVGWVALLHGRVLAAFRTSMEVGVTVHAENPLTGERHLTTSALLTFVAIDKDGQRVPVPPLLMETDADRMAFQEAQTRRTLRLARQKENQSWLKVMTPIAGA